MMSWFSCL